MTDSKYLGFLSISPYVTWQDILKTRIRDLTDDTVKLMSQINGEMTESQAREALNILQESLDIISCFYDKIFIKQ